MQGKKTPVKREFQRFHFQEDVELHGGELLLIDGSCAPRSSSLRRRCGSALHVWGAAGVVFPGGGFQRILQGTIPRR